MTVSSYEGALAATGTTALDAVADSHLPAVNGNGSIDVTVPAYSDPLAKTGVANSGTRSAPTDGSGISSQIDLTNANYKALVGSGDPALNAEIDASITFSSDFPFDFNPTDGIPAGEYDFIGVAVHEMGHALGFVSAADDFDYSTPNAGANQNFSTDIYWWGYGGDLFRYSAGDLNWAFNQDAYFSIDGGASAFNNAGFSTGEVNGDGWQASHWLAPTNSLGNYTCALPFVGIMNPYICNGKGDQTTASDLAFFDAIGWNSNVNVLTDPTYAFTTADMYAAFAPVPEPATWSMLALGFATCGAMMTRRARRRRRRLIGAAPAPARRRFSAELRRTAPQSVA